MGVYLSDGVDSMGVAAAAATVARNLRCESTDNADVKVYAFIGVSTGHKNNKGVELHLARLLFVRLGL